MDLDAITTRIREDRAGFLTGWVPNWCARGSSSALVERPAAFNAALRSALATRLVPAA